MTNKARDKKRTSNGFDITEINNKNGLLLEKTASAFVFSLSVPENFIAEQIDKFNAAFNNLAKLPDNSLIDTPEKQVRFAQQFMSFRKLNKSATGKFLCDDVAASALIKESKGTINDEPIVTLIRGPKDYTDFIDFYSKNKDKTKINADRVFSVTANDVSNLFTIIEFALNDCIYFKTFYKAFLESAAFSELPDTHPLKILLSSTDDSMGNLKGAFDTSDLEAVAASFECVTNYMNRINIPDKIQAHRMNFSVNPIKRVLFNFFVSAFNEFMQNIPNSGGVLDKDVVESLHSLNYCAVFPYYDRLIAFSRPKYTWQTRLSNANNDRGRRQTLILHNTTGPAVEYADGSQYFFINGVEVPRLLVEKPADKLTDDEILSLFNMRGEAEFTKIEYSSNVEYRREIIRIVGIARVLKALKAKVLDAVPQRNYELVSLDLTAGMSDRGGRMTDRDMTASRYLKMTNPSTGDIHVEGVDNSCNTVRDAIIFRNNLRGYTLVDNVNEETAKKDPNYATAQHYYQQGDVVMLPQGASCIFLYPKVIT